VRRGAGIPALGEPAEGALRNVVLGEAEVVPARVERDVLRREDGEVDHPDPDEPERPEGDQPGRCRGRSRTSMPDVPEQAANVPARVDGTGCEQDARQDREEEALVEAQEPAQDHAEKEDEDTQREGHAEVLANRKRSPERAHEDGVPRYEAREAPDAGEKPVAGVAPEEPLRDRIVIGQTQDELADREQQDRRQARLLEVREPADRSREARADRARGFVTRRHGPRHPGPSAVSRVLT